MDEGGVTNYEQKDLKTSFSEWCSAPKVKCDKIFTPRKEGREGLSALKSV